MICRAGASFNTTLGRRGTARTVLSYYVNEDVIDFGASFRSEQRRSNNPDDDIAFRFSDVIFDMNHQDERPGYGAGPNQTFL